MAFVKAQEKGVTSLILLGALAGARVDHLIANIFLLEQFKEFPWHLVDGDTRVFLLKSGEKLNLKGKKGDLLSLIPLGGCVQGIYGEGLFYPLDNLKLSLGHALGLSNVFMNDEVSLSLQTGKLLVLHIKEELT